MEGRVSQSPSQSLTHKSSNSLSLLISSSSYANTLLHCTTQPMGTPLARPRLAGGPPACQTNRGGTQYLQTAQKAVRATASGAKSRSTLQQRRKNKPLIISPSKKIIAILRLCALRAHNDSAQDRRVRTVRFRSPPTSTPLLFLHVASTSVGIHIIGSHGGLPCSLGSYGVLV